MELHNPAHPGEVLREGYITPLGVTVKAAAEWLGVTRMTLSALLNGRHGLSPEMAIRLEKAGWGSADHWLRMQMQRDLWEVRQRAPSIKVKRYPSPEPASA
jgi:addiction module HigA family antidote